MPASPDQPSYAKLKNEVVIFLVVIGVLLGAATLAAFNGLRDNPNQLWGMTRQNAIAMPLAVLTVWHLICGIGLYIRSKKIFAILGVVSGLCLTLFYFFFMISATGKLPVSLLSGAMVAIPLVLWSRVSLLLKAQDAAPSLPHR